MNYDVVGKCKTWTGLPGVKPTKFLSFNTGKVQGLTFVSGRNLELLAIHAVQPGSGDFREFMGQLKEFYDHIRFWAILNPRLGRVLERYNFVPGVDLDEYGDLTTVMDWSRPT